MDSTGWLAGCPSIDALLSGGREISLHIASCADCRIALKMLADEVLAEHVDADPGAVGGAQAPSLRPAGNEHRRWTDGAVTLPPLVAPPATGGALHDSTVLPERYEDLGWLGVGGMGEVRRVRDRALGRILAMKLISARLMGDEALVSRFVEEARVASQLEHPGLVPVHDVGELADGRLYFTMREIHGGIESFRSRRSLRVAPAAGSASAAPS